jgi:hypothetical protein
MGGAPASLREGYGIGSWVTRVNRGGVAVFSINEKPVFDFNQSVDVFRVSISSCVRQMSEFNF